MPVKLSAAWHEALGPDAARHDEYVNRWGNLTLFFSGYNIPASNKGFEEKKPYYSKSDVDLTKRLCDYEAWGPAQIEQRQRWLAGRAEKLWRMEVPEQTAVGTPTPGAQEVFREELGVLWQAVEPFFEEVSAEEIRQLAERLPEHLASHVANRGVAGRLAADLEALLVPWEHYDGGQRSIVRAAVAYFLESADAVPDDLVGGLADDDAVVAAARKALAPGGGG